MPAEHQLIAPFGASGLFLNGPSTNRWTTVVMAPQTAQSPRMGGPSRSEMANIRKLNLTTVPRQPILSNMEV